MSTEAASLNALPPLALNAALYCALALYLCAPLFAWVAPRLARRALIGGMAAHLIGLAGRGWLVGFLPLSNKMESFSAAAMAMAIVTLIWWRHHRRFLILPLLAVIATMVASLQFPTALHYPNPLLRTIWYPLHVPLSFVCYALWTIAAAAGLCWVGGRQARWLAVADRAAMQGLAWWTLSMFFGGIWGVVSWGASFLWDPKVLWSVILWFHYASLVHVRLTPSLRGRPGIRVALIWLGWLWMLVAYVGTSFFFGRSTHAF